MRTIQKKNALDSKFTATAGAAMVAFLLTACGGGGGGGIPLAATASPTSTTTSSPSTGNPQPSTAAPGSEEQAAFELLNNERLKCGFGALARNNALDAAARGHASWLLTNNAVGHYQVPGTPAFTGINPGDRLAAARYPAVLIEDLNTDVIGRSNAIGFGVIAVRALLSGPYHLMGLMVPYRDIGISVMSSDEVAASTKTARRVTAQIDIAYTSSEGIDSPPHGAVLSYPCDGTIGTFTKLLGESPNPLPERNLAASPVGQGIYLVGDASKTLSISSALLQESRTGNTLALLPPLTGANDPNHVLKSNESIVVPDAPLKTSTAYRVTIVGTNDGSAFTKQFTFTTGAISDATSAPN